MNFQACSDIIGRRKTTVNLEYFMSKKSKKKTVASTRKATLENEIRQREAKKANKKNLKTILLGSKEENKKSTTVESSKESDKEPKKTRKRLSPEHKQKIRGGLLILIGLFAITFIGWFLFGKLFSAESLANFLSANNTIAVLEINTDSSGNQTKLFYQTLSKYPVYQSESIVTVLNAISGIDYHKEIEPWLGRKIGLALGDNLQKLYFVESIDHAKTVDFISNKTLSKSGQADTGAQSDATTDYRGYKIYQFEIGRKFIGTFINNYFVVAEDQDYLRQTLDRYLDNQPKLSNDENYQKIRNNLPQGGLLFAYLNEHKLFDAITKDPKLSTEKGGNIVPFKPFLDLFAAEGFTVSADQGRFLVQSFTAIDKKSLGGQSLLTFSEKYRGDLLNIANEEAILFAGGHDLSKELSRFGDIFQSATQTSARIFSGLLEAQKERYFGKDISLKDDIYPLLKGEYLLTVENNFEKPIISVFLNLQNKTDDMVKLEKLISAFTKTGGIFTPRIQEVTLPDGTKGQEIVASPEKIERSDENYGSHTFTTLKLGNAGWSINMATIGDKLVISTDKESLQKIIDRSEGKITTSLAGNNLFNKDVKPLLQSADEVFNVKIGALSDVLGLTGNQILAPYLLPFSDFTATKNYFADGISTIYLVKVI